MGEHNLPPTEAAGQFFPPAAVGLKELPRKGATIERWRPEVGRWLPVGNYERTLSTNGDVAIVRRFGDGEAYYFIWPGNKLHRAYKPRVN